MKHFKLTTGQKSIFLAIVCWFAWYGLKPHVARFLPPDAVTTLDVGLTAAGGLALAVLMGWLFQSVKGMQEAAKTHTEQLDTVKTSVEEVKQGTAAQEQPGGAIDQIVRQAIDEKLTPENGKGNDNANVNVKK